MVSICVFMYVCLFMCVFVTIIYVFIVCVYVVYKYIVVSLGSFSNGTKVEVNNNEQYSEGLWFPTIVLRPLQNGKHLVEYMTLKTDDAAELLKEQADNSRIRPCPPVIQCADRFKPLEKVNAWYGGGWWVGQICKVFEGSKYTSCIVFGSLEVLGYGVLATQAFMKELKPNPCSDPLKITCDDADRGQVAMLYAGLYLVALGTGGLKAALPSLGADQFDEKVPEEAAPIPTYFNWLFFSFVSGGIFGVTFLVWVSTDQGWKWGFGVSTLAVAASVLFLCTGSSFYRHSVPKGSPLTRIFQVFVAAYRNRNLSVPETPEGFHEIRDIKDEIGTEIIKKSDQFKFLDRATIIRTTDGPSPNAGPWLMCTVTQVEEAKIIVRMLPIIMSTIFMNTCLAKHLGGCRLVVADSYGTMLMVWYI